MITKYPTRLPLYNVNGKTYIGEGRIVQDSDLIYDPEYPHSDWQGCRIVAINPESVFSHCPWVYPVGKLVGMFTNIKYK